METEDLVVDQRRQRQVVEQVGEVFPHVGVAVFAQAFVVEAVDLGDLAGFVVAAEDGDALGVADFEGDEEGHLSLCTECGRSLGARSRAVVERKER